MSDPLRDAVAREMEWAHNTRLRRMGLAREKSVRPNPDDARQVEAVARAAYEADNVSGGESWDDLIAGPFNTTVGKHWRAIARAVLTALAEAVGRGN